MTETWKPIKETIPEKVLQHLAGEWLDSFIEAAKAKSPQMMAGLFHLDCIMYGSEKGGPVDWPLPPTFLFVRESIRLRPKTPYCLAVARWTADSLIVGGPSRRGCATFFLVAEHHEERKRFVCAHAHFSVSSTDNAAS